MIKLFLTSAALILPLAISGCDRGPYDPSAHHHADASTGTMLSGDDSNSSSSANLNSSANGPSMNSNFHSIGGK